MIAAAHCAGARQERFTAAALPLFSRGRAAFYPRRCAATSKLRHSLDAKAARRGVVGVARRTST
jgi:hypothetical protein